ncbi:MAG TPA: hypothetical protein VE964_09990 [Myxococcales bacterium]|nr:hypothetical protein [Myxococcales bacterium]
MSPGFVVMVVLFLLSLAAGVGLGQWFFQLFTKTVPPLALSQFNAKSAQFFYLLYGGGVGVVLFVWALLGMMASRMLQMMKSGSKP